MCNNTVRFFVLTSLCIFLYACHSPTPICNRGFYVWKTSFDLDSTMRNHLKSLNIHRLYVRYFDVELGLSGPEPIAPLQFATDGITDFEVVPVVYITQPALLYNIDSDTLAKRIYNTVIAMHGGKPDEIQLDCDWTERTRERYFDLIRNLKTRNVTISSTLRLHQFKYKKSAGIPPADRAALMCYHTTNPEVYEDKNAILDFNEVKKYVPRDMDYPLPIDLALPVFSWGIKFKRQRFAGILSGLTREEVNNSGLFFKNGKHIYVADKAGTLKGVFLEKGDAIRIDEPRIGEVSDAAKLLSRRIRNKSGSILLFDLSIKNINRIGADGYEKIFRACEP